MILYFFRTRFFGVSSRVIRTDTQKDNDKEDNLRACCGSCYCSRGIFHIKEEQQRCRCTDSLRNRQH